MHNSSSLIATIQLGKNGLTNNFLDTLRGYFKRHLSVKISVLKSCCRNREELKKYSDKILEALGKNYTSRIIGYTVIVKKWRKARE